MRKLHLEEETKRDVLRHAKILETFLLVVGYPVDLPHCNVLETRVLKLSIEVLATRIFQLDNIAVHWFILRNYLQLIQCNLS